jgi:Holliday junction resolvase
MMADTPEAKVKRNVKMFLTKRDIYYTMPFTAGYGASGVPDILVCYQGKFIAIECKAGKNKPTALQADHIKRIQEGGGVAVVVNETNWQSTMEDIFNEES